MCRKSHFDNITAHKDLACGAPPSVSFGLIIFCVPDMSSSLSTVFHHRKVGAEASDDWRVCSDERVQRWNHSRLQFTGTFMLSSISAHVLAFQCLFLDCFNPSGSWRSWHSMWMKVGYTPFEGWVFCSRVSRQCSEGFLAQLLP